MNISKIILTVCAIAFCILPVNVSAETKEITKTATFTTSVKPFEYLFDDTIIENGIEYKLDKVDYEELSANDEIITSTSDNAKASSDNELKTISKRLTYKNLSDKNCNAQKTITVKDGNKKIKLKLQKIEYTEVDGQYADKMITSTTDFETEQNIPKTKVTTYNGEQVILSLESVSRITVSNNSEWSKLITCKEYDEEYFIFKDFLLPKKNSLNVNGFNSGILKSLGLNSNDYKISSISWNGKEYSSGGVAYRKAIIYGTKLVKTEKYRALYSGTVSIKGKTTYNAVCFYKGYSKPDKTQETTNIEQQGVESEHLWEVKATAHYVHQESDSFLIQNIVYIKLACIVIIGIAIIIVICKLITKQKRIRSDDYQ